MDNYFDNMMDDDEILSSEEVEVITTENDDKIVSKKKKTVEEELFGGNETLSYIQDILKERGIDPQSIKFQNEDGEIEETTFDALTDAEKKDLLLIDPERDNYDEDHSLEDSEIQLLNYLRDNNLTTEEFVNMIKEQTLAEQTKEQTAYTVDDFSDDELFIADYRNKYGEDFTDEELLDELEKAKSNDTIFQKRMGKVRDEYKNYENEQITQTENNAKLALEQTEQDEIRTVVNIASQLNEMHDTIELEDKDKEDILAFMFDKNAAGQTEFGKALSDPETKYKAAWYIKYGDEVIKDIHNYYQQEIAKITKEAKRSSPTQAVLIDNKNQTNNTRKSKDHLEEYLN